MKILNKKPEYFQIGFLLNARVIFLVLLRLPKQRKFGRGEYCRRRPSVMALPFSNVISWHDKNKQSLIQVDVGTM